jgi:hypothetical protein
MTVAGGKTITVRGSFLADSNGTIGNTTADWNLIVDGGVAALIKGRGKFERVKERTLRGGLCSRSPARSRGATIPSW